MFATAQAQPNIALVKYWGKRDPRLNLPATGSLPITLATLWTRTRVAFDESLRHDELRLNDAEDPVALGRVSACLDLLRRQAGTTACARVDSRNNFPTAAGLASSASGFAALVVAADAALGLALDRRTLSTLARRGSGAAARSLFGGFVSMAAGQREDGEDAFAAPVLEPPNGRWKSPSPSPRTAARAWPRVPGWKAVGELRHFIRHG
jgi:diphosphomevalonate decarboxylase